MTTTLTEQQQTTEVSFPVADQAIAEMREKYMPLKIAGVNDRAGYVMVRQARIEVKEKRCAVENRRKELKADALEWGRKVDAEAGRLKSLLAPIEEHLDAQEKAHDAEKERIKREAEETQRRKLQSRVDAMSRCRGSVYIASLAAMTDEEFESALRAAIKADEIRQQVEAEQKAERDRMEAERAAKAKEEAERLAAERAELERQRKEQAEAQAKIDVENRRIADERIAKERAEQAELERINAAERKAAEAARIESLRPDREKLMGVVAAIRAIEIPEVSADLDWLAHIVRSGRDRSAEIIEGSIKRGLGEQ